MTKRKAEEYTFADAYLSSFSAHLMPRRELLRVAACRDLAQAASVLGEFGYEDTALLAEGQIDAFIRKEQEALIERVFSVLPDPEVLAFNRYPFDSHNAKVCLKSQQLGRTIREEDLSACGTLPAAKMVRYLREQDFAFLPEEFRTGVREAVDLYARNGNDPQAIDLAMDRACYRQMLRTAEDTEEDFLRGFVRRQIDTANLKTFVRLREMGKPWAYYREVFVPGGEIPEQVLIAAWEDAYPRVSEKLAPYGAQEPMAEGGKRITDKHTVGLMERLLDDMVMDYVRPAKYEAFGPKAVQGYLYAKQTELRNLKIALAGCRGHLRPEDIEERLRETYV